jgi:hypothetical protein
MDLSLWLEHPVTSSWVYGPLRCCRVSKFEQFALTCLWFRYVDDTLTSLHKDEKNNFLEHLNQQNPSIQFTIEPELNGKIAFLDCRVIRAGKTLQTSVYRKPTSTDRLLDNSSYHPASHKSATIKTLVKRAHVVCSSSEYLKTELQHLNEIFDAIIIIIIIIKNFVCSPKGFSAYNYNMQFKIKLYYTIKNLSYDCLLKPSYI